MKDWLVRDAIHGVDGGENERWRLGEQTLISHQISGRQKLISIHCR